MTPTELRDRSRLFAAQVVRYCRTLPRDWIARAIGEQLLRAATSVAANHRAAGRARSYREFIAKLGIVVEECDETILWLELLPEACPVSRIREHKNLLREATELTAIFTAGHRTARARARARSVAKAQAHVSNRKNPATDR